MAELTQRSPAAPRSNQTVALRVAPGRPLPEQVAVGRGTALFVDGYCSHPSGIKRLEILVNERAEAAMSWDMPAPGSADGGDYWWAIVDLPAVAAPAIARISLRAKLGDGSTATAPIAPVELVANRAAPADMASASPAETAAMADFPGSVGEGVTIAMATYEPPPELFARQVQSIRDQTHQNWICVISDDASSEAALIGMREVIGDDPRFVISRSPVNQGFYANFERALTMVPAEANFIALTDQDDEWHPDKLRSLLDGLEPGSRLVYSDMRIVEEGGEVISETYWNLRRNNHTDFASLVLANTVTGAASLFERSLLDHALPFPPKLGNAYHDHWIAQVALATGGISYVDRPLYDYVQHGGAALGHLSANAHGRYGTPRLTRMRAQLARLRHSWRPGWRGLYFNLYCRVVLAARVLEMRCGPDLDRGKLRSLRNIADSARGISWLALRSIRPWWGANETLGRERAMLGGIAWHRGVRVQRRMSSLRGSGSERSEGSGTGPGREPVAGDSASSRERGSGDDWLEPILLDYFTRDGSTVMMHLLASSPGIAVENSYPFERKYFAYLWRWAQLIERGDWPEDEWGPGDLGSLNQFTTKPFMGPLPWHPRPLIEGPGGSPGGAAEDGHGAGRGRSMGEIVFDSAWREFSRRAAARHRLEREAPEADVRYFAEKHLNTWMVDLERMPAVKLIVLLRDPRDTWVSINSFNDLRGNAALGRENAAGEREHMMQVIARQRERLRWIAELQKAEDVPVVRYEDLVRDIEAVAERIGSWLGVELDPGLVERERAVRTRHVSAKSPEESIGRWRRELGDEAAQIFKDELGDELRAVGLDAD